jgi:MoaA/NifB/PqqE/SkfB family radical SAM enzyme
LNAAGLGPSKKHALERAQPLSVHLELTYACNWRCLFCYNPRHFDKSRMSLAEWVEVLDDLRALGTLWVTLTGGEALAHPEFLQIARAARERRLAVKVFTNGSLIDEAMADALAALPPAAVEISLHGSTAEVHERTTAKAGSFEAALAGFARLKQRGVPLLLKVPLTRWNEHELDELVALSERLGAPLRIDPKITPRDDGDRAPLQHAASKQGNERLMRMLVARGQLPHARREPDGANCGIGRLTLAVDPEGNVYPCIQWRARSMGNVRKVRLKHMWAGSQARLEAAEASRAANAALVAAGGALASFPYCPALAMQSTGDPLQPSSSHIALAEAAALARGSAL